MYQGIQHHCPILHMLFVVEFQVYTLFGGFPLTPKEELVQRNATVMDKLKGDLPVYHTRAMRKAAVGSF